MCRFSFEILILLKYLPFLLQLVLLLIAQYGRKKYIQTGKLCHSNKKEIFNLVLFCLEGYFKNPKFIGKARSVYFILNLPNQYVAGFYKGTVSIIYILFFAHAEDYVDDKLVQPSFVHAVMLSWPVVARNPLNYIFEYPVIHSVRPHIAHSKDYLKTITYAIIFSDDKKLSKPFLFVKGLENVFSVSARNRQTSLGIQATL